jgi:hypothetical protein
MFQNWTKLGGSEAELKTNALKSKAPIADLDRLLLPKNAEARMAVPPIPPVINRNHHFVQQVPN